VPAKAGPAVSTGSHRREGATGKALSAGPPLPDWPPEAAPDAPGQIRQSSGGTAGVDSDSLTVAVGCHASISLVDHGVRREIGQAVDLILECWLSGRGCDGQQVL